MNPKRTILIGGSLSAVVIAALLVFASTSGGRPQAASSGGAASQGATLGSAEAPVLIEEFADFQCPFCGRFNRETEPQLVENYVKPGKARLVFKHLAFIGQESVWAAQAAECAGNEGRFWLYHDKLFASQAGENRGAFAKDKLKGFARELGLEAAGFDRCLDGDETLAKVRADTAEADRRGVKSTPTFYLNTTEPIQGALPYDAFKQAIDKLLPSPR